MNKLSKTELKYTKSKPIDQLSTLEAIKVMIDEQMLGIKILTQEKFRIIINSSYEHLSRFKKVESYTVVLVHQQGLEFKMGRVITNFWMAFK